jgi:hypothetical protein
MKKIFAIGLLVSFSTVGAFASPEELDMYTHLYNASPSNTAQLEILQSMADSRLTGAGEFYGRALRRLVSEYSNIREGNEKNAADEQALILSSLLGAEKYAPAANDLWLVVDGFQNPLVKAEAMMALGKIRATAYIPQVIRVLNSTNVAPTPDRLHGERIAFGAIIALEKYQDPSGYLPVFFAYQGRYSSRIRDQARRSLPVISQDPTQYMLEVVRGPAYDYPTKFAALETMEATTGVNTRSKASVAVAALNEGWRANTTDVQLRLTLANMRKLAMNMITRYKTDDDAVYPLLERSYSDRLSDMDEKTSAIRTLAALGTEESARRLSNFLMTLNSRRQSGAITRDEEALARVVMTALGTTRQPIGRPALNAVLSLDWVPAIKAIAQESLRQIGN